MSANSQLIVSQDLHDFFREEVLQARKTLQIKLSPTLEYYVVHLLADYSKRDDIRELLDNEPMALLQQRAQQAGPSLGLSMYKSLGDRALYKSGFFAESLQRSIVDSQYYATMGAVAYLRAAQLVSGNARQSVRQTYASLAEYFSSIVELLNHISAQAQQRSGRDIDLLRLYERYTRTHNAHTLKALQDHGLSVDTTTDNEPVH